MLALATIVGALGAHALRGVLDARELASLDTAVEYQFFHALGLFGVALCLARENDAGAARRMTLAARLLLAGILCFSGSIYMMLAGAPRLFGFVTPLGGVLLIAAWLIFGVTMLRSRSAAS